VLSASPLQVRHFQIGTLGRVNRKKGSDATVDMSEIKNGDLAKAFIIQVAALS
jgi:hypothetical protein